MKSSLLFAFFFAQTLLMGKVSAKFEHQDRVFHSMVVFFIPWPVSLVTVFDNGYMVLAQKTLVPVVTL